MAHFYGRLQGQAGEATRTGSKSSGITARGETWRCSGEVRILTRRDGGDSLMLRFGSKRNADTIFLLRDPDATAQVMDDPKIKRLFERVYELSARIEAETPKAQRRAEKRR